MNREHKIFLGWGTGFKRDIYLKEQRKECWIGRGAKTINKQGILCVGGRRGRKTVNVPFLIPYRAHKVPFLIIQRVLEVPFFIKLPCPFLFLG